MSATLTHDMYATDINDLHGLVLDGLCITFVYARQAGEKLIKAKQQVPHGQWEQWIAHSLKPSVRQCQKYMQFARAAQRLPDDGPKLLAVWKKLDGNTPKADSEPKSAVNGAFAPKNPPEGPENEGGDFSLTQVNPRSQPENGDSESPPEAPEPEAPEPDADGREIPAHLVPVFEQQAAFKRLWNQLSRFRADVKAEAMAHPDAWTFFPIQAFESETKQALDHLKLFAPHIVCCYCGGVDSENCKACKGAGFLTASQARCAPREMRHGAETSHYQAA